MSKPYFDGVYNSSDEQEDESAYNYESEPSSNEEDEQEKDVKMRRRRHIEEQGEEGDEEEGDATIPPWACCYCLNDDVTAVAQCAVCKRWFCNSQCKSRSHIIQHLIYNDHRSIILHPDGLIPMAKDTPLSCLNNAQHTNVFSLGIIQSVNGDYTIICRDNCLDRSRLKEIGWDADSWTHIIQNRHFVDSILSNGPPEGQFTIPVSQKEIQTLESLWKTNPQATIYDIISNPKKLIKTIEKVPSRFENAEEYSRIFSPLIRLDMEADEVANNLKRITDVSITWDTGIGQSTIATFVHDQLDSRYRMNVGQEIVIHYETKVGDTVCEGNYAGKVIHIDNNRIKVLMQSQEEPPTGRQTGFSVTFCWNATPFTRMLKAVSAYFNPDRMSDFIYQSILGYNVPDKEYPPVYIKSYSLPNFKQLNGFQLDAVKNALNKHLTLIQGPPGTGKTGPRLSLR